MSEGKLRNGGIFTDLRGRFDEKGEGREGKREKKGENVGFFMELYC